MESFLQPVLIALALMSSYAQMTYTLVATSFNRQGAKTQCEKDGKEFLSWCSGTKYECVQKLADAGVACNGTSQRCLGFCVTSGTGTGVCSEYQLPKQLYDKYVNVTPQEVLGQLPAAIINQSCLAQ